MEWAFLPFCKTAKDQVTYILEKHSSQLSAHFTPSLKYFFSCDLEGKVILDSVALFFPFTKVSGYWEFWRDLCIRVIHINFFWNNDYTDCIWLCQEVHACLAEQFMVPLCVSLSSSVKQKVEPVWPCCKAESFICVWEGLCEQASSDCTPLWARNLFQALAAFQFVLL